MVSRDEHSESRSEKRKNITRLVVLLGLACYAVIAWVGDELPGWAKYGMFGLVAAAAIAADAWEVGVRQVVDPNRWWRLGLLLLIALAGFVWLVLGG